MLILSHQVTKLPSYQVTELPSHQVNFGSDVSITPMENKQGVIAAS